MTVLDPGHCYALLQLDGGVSQILTFVKREGDKYPGNIGRHGGTNLQSVIRALIDRVVYLTGQGEALGQDTREDIAIINNLRDCLFLLEHRAARMHGFDADRITQYDATHGVMCPACGHVMCDHHIP